MNKVFMTCLDNIIELEKTSIIQDRTMESLQNKISMMGKRTKIDKPEMPAVQYQAEDESFDSDLTVRVAGIFAVLGAVIAFFISYDDAAGQFFI